VDAWKEFDWHAAGVEKTYIILVTGRCGSTHLAELLKSTHLCGEPSEYFNELYLPHYAEAAKAADLRDYIRRIAASYSSNGCFGFKIDYWRLEALRSLVDFDALFPSSATTHFLMTRQDIVSQAYSFAVARATGNWHETSEATTEREYLPEDREIWLELLLIAAGESGLAHALSSSRRTAIRLTYEEMVQDRQGIVGKVLDALRIEHETIVMPDARKGEVRQIAYKARDAHVSEFRTKYVDAIAVLEEQRECLSWQNMTAKLEAEYGITVT